MLLRELEINIPKEKKNAWNEKKRTIVSFSNNEKTRLFDTGIFHTLF